MSEWMHVYDGFSPADEGLREALCTLGNGYLATRGAAPESCADGVHYPGTYVAGVYNRLRSDVAGRVLEDESLVNLPNWLPLKVAAADGPWLDLTSMQVLELRQTLDLRRGVLVRRMRVRDQEGHVTRVTQRRLVHLHWVHLAALETTVVPENWSGPLRVRSELDGTVRNAGVARYRDLAGCHLEPVEARALDEASVLLVVRTSQSRLEVAEAARTRVVLNGEPIETVRTLVDEPGRIGHELAVEVAEGDEVVIEKVVAVTTSRDRAISEPVSSAVEWLRDAADFDELLERHVLAWTHAWQRFCFFLEGDDVLPTLRLHAFHLLQTLSAGAVDDLDAGVPARGLHGEAYRGHVFWDELFVFPIFNLRLPELTRALLRYRYRRLPAARRAAREAGYAGAMYPWQSGSDGREESARVHLNPQSGRWLADPTYRQRHIGLAVAYNVWQYYQATGDRGHLSHYGGEMLLEIARFFASLADYDHVRDRYVLRGVIGPDEFHTGYPDRPEEGIDNNAYTNLMAVWVLRRALETLDLVDEPRRTELIEQLELSPAERQRWTDITRRMFVPFHDGLISQFEGYEGLAELDWDAYRAKYGDIHRLDRILEAEGDTPNRYKLSKQADVLMLFYLLSADELAELMRGLGYEWDPQSIPRTIDYYLARTSHGSTLSAVVHAWVLARAHRERSMEFFFQALRSDVADIQGGTTAEGIHLAAMAGSIDLLQRCFAGVGTHDDVLWVEPQWPEQLGVLEFAIRYRMHGLVLRIAGRTARLSAVSGPRSPVRVGSRGRVSELEPGQSIDFALPKPGGQGGRRGRDQRH